MSQRCLLGRYGLRYDPLSGLNGLWVVNALSQSLTIEVHRAAQFWSQTFRGQQPVSSARELDRSMQMGTVLTFYPDKTIFEEDAHIEWESLCTYLSQSSYLIPGVGFRLCDWRKGSARVVHFPPTTGVLPYVVDLTRDQHPLSAPLAIMHETRQTTVHIGFQYSQGGTRILSFVNNHQTVKHGSHVVGFLDAWLWVLRTLSRQMGVSGSEARLRKRVTTNLTAVVSVRTPRPSFAGCTTDELSNPVVQQAVYDVTKSGLQSYLDMYPEELRQLLAYLPPS